jgi:tetratricopeptide (TPR) repeat protein
MRSLSLSLLVLALSSSTASARKPRPPRADTAQTADAAVTELAGLMQEGRWGDVFKKSAQAVVRHPHHAMLRYYHGLMLMMTSQYQEAEREFRKAVELEPEFVEALVSLGENQDILGDDARAQESFQAALKLEPDHADAKTSLEAITKRRQLREATQPLFAEGTPQRVVQELMAAMKARTLGKRSAEFVSARGFAALLNKAGLPDDERGRREFLMGVEKALDKSNSGQIQGYMVRGELKSEAGDDVQVTTDVLVEQTPGAQEIAQYRAVWNSPLADTMLNKDVLAIYRALPPEEQKAMMDRQLGQKQTSVVLAELKLRKESDGWRIYDAGFGVPGTSWLRASDFMANLPQLAAVAGVAHPKERTAYSVGYAIGQLIGRGAVLAALVGGILFLVRRLVKRRIARSKERTSA